MASQGLSPTVKRLRRAYRALLFATAKAVIEQIPAARANRPVRRSLWAGTPILTMAFNARAERLLGVEAESLVFETYYVTDEFDRDLSRWAGVPLLRLVLPYLVLIWACARYQRFHFYSDRGILYPTEPRQFPPEELALLRQLGKEVFIWTYGADVRTEQATRQLGEFHCCLECPAPGSYCVCADEDGRRNQAVLREHATARFSMGDMIEYTPGSRNDLFFWPIDLDAEGGARYAPSFPAADTTRPLRIVHAPNHRHFKGSRYLEEAIDQLRRDGHAVELDIVSGVPNRVALERYRTADVVFDQCLIGFHGYLALEAMALGKPVMVYIRDPQRYLLNAQECPLLNTPPDRITTVIRELLADRSRLRRLGVQGRRYIESHFTLTAFAGRLERAYRDLEAARES